MAITEKGEILKKRISRRTAMRVALGAVITGGLVSGGFAIEKRHRKTSPSTPTTSASPDQGIIPGDANAQEIIQTPNEIKVRDDDGISEEDKMYIEEGALIARDFYYKELGTYMKAPALYIVKNDSSYPYLGTPSGTASIINVGHPEWGITPPLRKKKIAAHEYFHVMQGFLSKKDLNNIGLWWLTEGGAEYAGYAAIIDRGLTTYEEVKSSDILILKSSKKLPAINSLTWKDKGPTYRLGFLAVDFLVRDRGVKLLGEYLRNVARNPWQQAFSITFGESINDFQDRFEAWRKENNL